MRLFTIAAVGALILGANAQAAPATAQTPTAQTPRTANATVHHAVNITEMSQILTDRGFAVVKANQTELSVTTTTGFKFSITLMACDLPDEPAGCLGVSMVASWDMKAGDAERIKPVLQTFNEQYRIGKALIINNAIYSERYAITDGGVTLAHLGREVDEFLNSSDLLITQISEVL